MAQRIKNGVEKQLNASDFSFTELKRKSGAKMRLDFNYKQKYLNICQIILWIFVENEKLYFTMQREGYDKYIKHKLSIVFFSVFYCCLSFIGPHEARKAKPKTKLKC